MTDDPRDVPSFIPPPGSLPPSGIELLQFLADDRLACVTFRDDRGSLCNLIANGATRDGCIFLTGGVWLIRRRRILGRPPLSSTEFQKADEAFRAITYRPLKMSGGPGNNNALKVISPEW